MNELPEKDLCYTINKLLYSAARLVKSPDLHNHSKATDINPHRRRTNLSFETSENKHYDVYSQQGHREHITSREMETNIRNSNELLTSEYLNSLTGGPSSRPPVAAAPTPTTRFYSQHLSQSSSTPSYSSILNHHHLLGTPQNSLYNLTTERMIGNLNNLNLNQLNNYSASSTSSGVTAWSPNGGIDINSEALARKDQEIERWRMRSQLLEQQMNMKENYKCTNSANPDTVNLEMKLKEFEHEASCMRNKLNAYNSNQMIINDLENLLNQREYEIQELKLKYNTDMTSLEREATKFKTLLNIKEEELLGERNKTKSLQKDLEKISAELKETNNYMSQLPTKDEVKDGEVREKEARRECETMRAKMAELDKKIRNAKLFVKEKNVEINNYKEKIDVVEMEKIKLAMEFANYKQATQSVGELMERCEENASLKAELDIAKKLLANLQEKLRMQQSKHEGEISELQEKISFEQDTAQAIRKDLEIKEKQLDELERSVKEVLNQNQTLISQNLNLNDKLKSFEVLSSADSFKLFKLLFKELSNCTVDLECLAENCIDIYNGRQIDVCSLLGTPMKNEYVDLTTNDTIIGLMNTDFVLRKTNELKSLRKKLDDIKKMITDQYAEKIGGNISCQVQ